MASQNIDLTLRVKSDGSMEKATQGAQKLNKEKEKLENRDYGVARSAVGTGAAGRDFAKQAEGLGGLVRVYATFAANAFAAQAAFTALSNAMDTANMAKGMDQLGAASGSALGTLSKQFSAVTQGAISFRDAASAVTKATASGLGSAQTLEIAKVATKASQALGIDLNDAVSRLSRGITKLEPELLDELGIFTKIEPAVEAYARTLGKTASQLTDFERRQAFAIAVLDEGNKKFAEIQLDTNPYTKLLASFKDLAQTGLTLVNTVLAPVVKLLSESPNALAGVVALIGTSLVRQAIPALTSWRNSLHESAEEARNTANSILNSYGERFLSRLDNSFKVPLLEEQANVAKESARKTGSKVAEAFSKAVQDGVVKSSSGIAKTMAAGGVLTKKDAASLTRSISSLKGKDNITDEDQIRIKQLETLRTKVLEYVAALKAEAAAEAALSRAKNLAYTKGETARPNLEELARINNAKRAREKAKRLGLYENIEQAAREGGLGTGFGAVKDAIKDMPGTFNKIRVAGTGTLIALRAGISALLGPVMAFISTAMLFAPLFIGLYEKLRGSSKEIEATASAFEELDSSINSASKTLEYYNNKASRTSVEGTSAASTAILELSNSFNKAADAATKELNSGKNNTVYSFIEGVQNLFNFGTQAELSAKSVESVAAAFQLLESNTTFFNKFKNELIVLLKLPSSAGISDILKAIKVAAPEVQQKVAKLLNTTSTSWKGITEETKTFNDSLSQTSKTFDNIINSILPSSGIGAWAIAGQKEILSLNKELDKGVDNFGQIVKLSQSSSLYKTFGPNTASTIATQADRIKELGARLEDTTGIDQKIDRVKQGIKDAALEADRSILYASKVSAQRTVKELENQLVKLQQAKLIDRVKVEQEINAVYDTIRDAQEKDIVYFAGIFAAQVAAGFSKAALILEKSRLATIFDPSVKARAQYSVSIKETNIQAQQLESTISLIQSLDALKISVDEANLSNRASGLSLDQVIAQRQGIDQRREVLDAANPLSVINKYQKLLLSKDSTEEQKNSARAFFNSSAYQTAQRLASAKAQMSEVNAQRTVAKETLSIDERRAESAKTILELQQQSKNLNLDKQAAELGVAYSTAADKAREIARLEMQMLDVSSKIKQQELELNVRLAEDKISREGSTKANLDNLKYTEKQLADYNSLALREKEILGTKNAQAIILAEIDSYYKNITMELDNQISRTNILQQQLETSLSIDKQIFAAKASLGLYSEQEIQDANAKFAREEARLELQKQIAAEQSKIDKASATLNKNLLDPTRTSEQIGFDIQEYDRQNTEAKAAIDNYTRLNQVKLQAIQINNSMTVEQKKFTDFATKGFESMGDALADFAMTGKLNFKSLIDSMISDFIRMVMRMNMQKLAGGSNGQDGLAGIIGKFIGSMLTPSGSYSSGTIDFSRMTTDQLAVTMANGGAFDSGVQKFANGGMFTNSIVHQPTLFKFAKGTGLMGEAGPEAIMPLTRDSNGRLGVQAQGTQPSVDIVVNNYSNQQATTKETTDSRGNRRIEVVVGEMNAAEMARPGSASQNTMRNNYGVQPSLIRR